MGILPDLPDINLGNNIPLVITLCVLCLIAYALVEDYKKTTKFLSAIPRESGKAFNKFLKWIDKLK